MKLALILGEKGRNQCLEHCCNIQHTMPTSSLLLILKQLSNQIRNTHIMVYSWFSGFCKTYAYLIRVCFLTHGIGVWLHNINQGISPQTKTIALCHGSKGRH